MAAPTEIWPVTVSGWVVLIGFPCTVLALVFSWGRFFGKLEDILKKVTELEVKVNELDPNLSRKLDIFIADLERIEEDTQLLKITMWGVHGDNGITSDIKEMRKRLDAVQTRNNKLDAIREREEGARQAGVEHRLIERRREDRILRGEDPDE